MVDHAVRRTDPKKEGMLEVASDLHLDETAATQTFGIVARKGGGKTFLASKLVEQLYRLKCPVVVIDPVGNWWGLTVAANGKDKGLSFVVLGGERGDLALTPEGGAAVADLVIGRNLNVVLDVSSFSKSNMRRFVADFAERFFEKSKTKRQARMVVFEEAQRFAPQQFKGQERMLGAVEDIVRLGRNYGLGCMLISQRPQSVNKEVLSQVECLFVGQINESHARKALVAWIVEKSEDLHTRMDELASLSRGQFFVWSPSWLRIFKKITVLPKWTFDASSTPGIGEASSHVEPPVGRLSPGDLQELRAAMEVVDPTVKSRNKGAVPTVVNDVLEERLEREQALRKAAEEQVLAMQDRLTGRGSQIAHLQRCAQEVLDRLNYFASIWAPALGTDLDADLPRPSAPPHRAPSPAASQAAPKVTQRVVVEPALPRKGPTVALGKCSKALLTVLVQQGKPLSKPRLALMAGYSANSGSFNNSMSELRTKGWLDGHGQFEATAAGRKAIGFVEPLPTRKALFEYWLSHPRLDKCSRAIFTALRAAPRATKNELGATTGYSVNSGSFNNSLSRLRTLGLIEGRGDIMLSPDLR